MDAPADSALLWGVLDVASAIAAVAALAVNDWSISGPVRRTVHNSVPMSAPCRSPIRLDRRAESSGALGIGLSRIATPGPEARLPWVGMMAARVATPDSVAMTVAAPG